uniref:uncharacterized protein LOC120334297 n=1 Tax=Styela clava TaxID=7725 RepID=UPI001939A8EA|nr:uncharacterized protein LOC120334297 [Styela clava]
MKLITVVVLFGFVIQAFAQEPAKAQPEPSSDDEENLSIKGLVTSDIEGGGARHIVRFKPPKCAAPTFYKPPRQCKGHCSTTYCNLIIREGYTECNYLPLTLARGIKVIGVQCKSGSKCGDYNQCKCVTLFKSIKLTRLIVMYSKKGYRSYYFAKVYIRVPYTCQCSKY